MIFMLHLICNNCKHTSDCQHAFFVQIIASSRRQEISICVVQKSNKSLINAEICLLLGTVTGVFFQVTCFQIFCFMDSIYLLLNLTVLLGLQIKSSFRAPESLWCFLNARFKEDLQADTFLNSARFKVLLSHILTFFCLAYNL